jgi:ubiquinone/menaquinone biosynthesis C-methylase UbiE
MLYCPNCQRLSEGDCPNCGKKARKLREVRAHDPVHFFTGDYIHTSMVEPLLAENDVPYSKMSAHGAALSMITGNYLEQYLLYVPYAAYDRAVQLVAGAFGADEGFMRSLETLGVNLDEQADEAGNADQARVAAQYAAPDRHDVRRALHARFTIADIPYSDWLLDRIGLEPGMRILDIGCGSGDIWAYRALPEGLSITMADASEGMLEAATERTKGIANARFEFVRADACDMPFEDETYDMVLASHMLFHVPDLYAALSEIARVLKPDGHLSATTMSRNNLKEMYALAERHSVVLPQPSNSFTMEDGRATLVRFFNRVSREEYVSSLQVTEAEPLVKYIQSVDTFGSQSEEAVRAMREEIQNKIDETGSYDISKLSCLFVCAEKRASDEEEREEHEEE